MAVRVALCRALCVQPMCLAVPQSRRNVAKQAGCEKALERWHAAAEQAEVGYVIKTDSR